MLDRSDTGALPMTEPHSAPIFDTGPHPHPLRSYESDLLDAVDYDLYLDDPRLDLGSKVPSGPLSVPAAPVLVPGQFQFVKRWKLFLVLFGVWIGAAAVGIGLYQWWFYSIDKTWPDTAVLFYVIACVVGALLGTLAEPRPMISSLSLGVMSAPFASACVAGVLYGAYAFGWITP